MPASSNLRVIEVRDGHLPEGVNGKDITERLPGMTLREGGEME